jgi:hypothetical protein
MVLKGVKSDGSRYSLFPKNRRAQVAIFIIIAILIIAIVVLFFIFKGKLFPNNQLSSGTDAVYNTFTSCLEDDLSLGVNVLESQGGYIYLPDYESGSDYMPFSSQLNFLGSPIPYWYYVSGNNVEKEQVPSKVKMQKELETFMDNRVRTCFFDNYYAQGYEILMGTPDSTITINDREVILNLKMDFSILKGEESYVAREHKIILSSQLGSLYNSALKVYDEEQKTLFLEEYGVDILRLYAPVDGIEMSCSPKIWNANNVFSDLRSAIEANTLALKNSNNKKEYFEVQIPDIPSKQKVRFLNSQNWSYSFEVNPSEGPIMIANPVGNQQGLGILGFCYVPYHFVYNMNYPVLTQVISGNEIFQFPLAVVIKRNLPRNASEGEALGVPDTELCKDMNTLTNVSIYNSNLKPVSAEVYYECLGTKCNMGTAKGGNISEEFPQCVNGFINVKADGYKEESVMYSTISEGSLNIYLTKIYNLSVQLKIDNKSYSKDAIIYFISDDYSQTVLYPQQKNVELAEGDYEVQVYIYKNSTLKLGATTQQQCVTVPRSSIGGILGLTKKECFDVQVPAQVISDALSGGGKQNYTFTEAKLKSSKTVNIYAKSLPNPDSLDQLQTNYIIFESNPLGVEVK